MLPLKNIEVTKTNNRKRLTNAEIYTVDMSKSLSKPVVNTGAP
jgi:hypothetical protein